SHRWTAGAKDDLVFLRPGVLAGAIPPAPDQDLKGKVLDLFPGRVLCGLVPGVLCGAEAPDKLHDDYQINPSLLVRPLCHASVLLCFYHRSSPAFRPPTLRHVEAAAVAGLSGGLMPPALGSR